MPDLGSHVLDVVLGLAFVYLVFSLVCSALQELVATRLSWRAENLEEALRSMFQGVEAPVKDDPMLTRLVEHSRIKAMLAPKRVFGRETVVPDYLSARTFSTVLLDTIAPPKEGESKDLFERLRTKIDQEVPHESLRDELRSMIDATAGRRDELRAEIENWFDDTMNRASGWYRRKAQLWLVIFGMAVAVTVNVDTIHIADRLWTDPTTRAAVVAQAEDVADAGDTEQFEQQLREEDLDAFELPVGWGDTGIETGEGAWTLIATILLKILGLVITGLALSFGAPFWFDALSKVSRLRPTGKPEGRAPGTANP